MVTEEAQLSDLELDKNRFYDPIRILDHRKRIVSAINDNGTAEEIQFSKQVFQVLEQLLDNPEIVVDRKEIGRVLYGRATKTVSWSDQENYVSTTISRIRKALPQHSKIHIESVRGQGYKYQRALHG